MTLSECSKKEIIYNTDGDDTSGVKELKSYTSNPKVDSEIFLDETRTPNKDFFYFNSDTKIEEVYLKLVNHQVVIINNR